MKTLRREIKQIAVNLLTTDCIYEYKNKNGWICGFGRGLVAIIEDHKNELSIKTYHFENDYDINISRFIEDIVHVNSYSSNNIDERISVDLCDKLDYPEESLIETAKQKLRFNKIEENELIKDYIDLAIDQYYLDLNEYINETFKLI